MKVPYLDLKWQHEKIKDNLKVRWDKILENTAFVIGDEVKLFEKNFADFCGTKHCVGVSSGTDALILALKALNLPKGSEIICLPTSFIASAEAIVHAGLVPKFSEIDLETGNYDYELLDRTVTNRTSAIMAVHLYGRPCDMDKVLWIAKKYNLKVIEDAAQAQGAVYIDKNGIRKVAGSMGDVGCFSFYPGKNLGAYGQAGGIVTNDDKIAELVRRMRDHGSLGKYDHDVLGYNAKIDNIQASVLDEKLKYLNEWNKIRGEVAKKYYDGLKDIKEIDFISPNNQNTISSHHIFAIRVPDRNKFMEFLKTKEIATNITYPQALHTFTYLQESGCKIGDFPLAEKLQSETVSLPIYPGMSENLVNFVIDSIKEFFFGKVVPGSLRVTESPPEKGEWPKAEGVIRLGIVGYGYWSPKVMNGFKNANSAQLYAICEKDKGKWPDIEKSYPGIKIYLNFEELVKDENVDAIVITTTVSSHYRIAKASLLANKHVLVEKPMTEEVWQAEELINLAKKQNKTLMVDHTFLFMPAVRALKKIIDSNELGKIHSIVGTRANLGLIQKDVDVVKDLAPHDFSIMYYLFGEEPGSVKVSGSAPITHKYHRNKINSISNVSLKYRGGRYINLLYSWLAPIKDRRMVFIGENKMCVFDMLDKEGQIKIYDTKVEVLHDANPYGSWFNYINGNYKIVELEKLEGDDLKRMAQEFIDSINQKREPLTNGVMGKVVVRTLKRIENVNKPKLKRYLGNMRNNFIRIWNGNFMLK
jgi:dTDP-4-amino-4,6-dideoxygalactose transaminase/predicted dehydrogenase